MIGHRRVLGQDMIHVPEDKTMQDEEEQTLTDRRRCFRQILQITKLNKIKLYFSPPFFPMYFTTDITACR